MKTESQESITIKFVFSTLTFELIIFFIAYLRCMNEVTWVNFSSELFLVGVFSLIISIVLLRPGAIHKHKFLGRNFTPVNLEGPQILMPAMGLASIIAIVLSLAASVFASM